MNESEKKAFKQNLEENGVESVADKIAEGIYGKEGPRLEMAKHFVTKNREREALKLAKESVDIAREAKDFAKQKGWISIVISILSALVAVGALLVSIFR